MSFAKRIVEIRHSKTFELAMIFVIIVSALNVGAHTYKGLAPYEHILSYLDVCITTILQLRSWFVLSRRVVYGGF